MRKRLLTLVVLLAGGCVSDKGPDAGAPDGAKASQTKESSHAKDRDSGEPEKVCVDTIEGTESKRICY